MTTKRRSTRVKAHISINAQVIRRNAKTDENNPPIRIARSKSDKKPVYAHDIKINGPSRLIYSPAQPIMRCGARMVLMTDMFNVEIVK